MQQGVATQFSIECGGIVFDEKKIMEVNSGQVMVWVNRADIQRITLKFGFLSAHPILQALMGLALLAPAYIPIMHLIRWLQHGGRFWTAEAFVIPFAVVGAGLTCTAFRRGVLLLVESTAGRKRLAFQRVAETEEIERFVGSIEANYRLRVQREIAPGI